MDKEISEATRYNLEQQIKMTQGYITLWQTEIVSGAYKFRKIFKGLNGPEMTDDEKLKDAMMTLERHVTRLRELVEASYKPVDDTLLLG